MTTSVVADIRAVFTSQKQLADRAVAQLSDGELHQCADEEANSVAIVMKHMAGNMRSRWTDFLTTDGEKPDRNRDQEFEANWTQQDWSDRERILADWESGWRCLFEALTPLTDDDLTRTVTIRSEPHSVSQALLRQVSHYGYHVGQIVLLARHLRGDEWRSLSIPKGHSQHYNRQMMAEPEARE